MTIIVDENRGLLITWTCYGTWLPGDERGFVSNKLKPTGSFERKINAAGERPHTDDSYTRAVAAELQKWPPVYLSPDDVFCVAKSLCEVAKNRQWRIPRAAIMRTHVHIVVRECPDDGPAVRRVLKGATQADLCELCAFSDDFRRSDRRVAARRSLARTSLIPAPAFLPIKTMSQR